MKTTTFHFLYQNKPKYEAERTGKRSTPEKFRRNQATQKMGWKVEKV